MRIRQAGQIDDGLWLLGAEESCVYLLEGTKTSVLISAGMPYILPDLFRQMASWGMKPEKIEHVVILHAHFDHIGVVPYLKRNRPGMKIYASARGWEVLANPRAIDVINEFSEKVRLRMKGSEDALAGMDWKWRDDVKGETLAQGDSLDIGGRPLEFFETPGHSSCSISAWVPGLNILFPSDAVAIPYRDEYIIAVGSSFEKYLASLDKLAGLDVRMICADHYGCVEGVEAREYIGQTRAAALQMMDRMREALAQEGSVEAAARQLIRLHYERRPDYFVHPDILLRTYTQMLKQLTG
ncbi:MAG TPA: MBL fold metallo-hydrolase [Smithellaceae bacterium]|nr:MBL fold metallo-hydrolase [Smithellaceae bacterium]